MRQFHHVGIPTTEQRDGETYLPDARLYVTDAQTSANRIEWLRFEPDSPMPRLLKTTAHIAYQVDDLQAEMQGRTVLLEPFSPVPGLTVAFVVEEGAPIELMTFEK